MDQSTDTCVSLVFNGPRTVATSEETLQSLRDAFHRGLPVEIDCTALTAVDLSFIQLLIAGQRSLSAAGRGLTVRAQASGPLKSGLKAGGFAEIAELSAAITFVA